MSSEKRYCNKCKCDTLHDIVVRLGNHNIIETLISRFLWALITAGVSEAMMETNWRCQKCSKETPK